MESLQKYKQEILAALFIVAGAACFVWLFELLMPVVLGLLLAFAVAPVVSLIQKVVKKRAIANTIFLAGAVGIIIFSLAFLTQFLNRDFNRLNQSFHMLISSHEAELDAAGEQVKAWAGEFFDVENLEAELMAQADSLYAADGTTGEDLDTESIKASLEQLFASFGSDEEEQEKDRGISGFIIFFMSLFYFVLILYEFEYFDGLRKKYFRGSVESKFQVLLNDFNQSFVRYFKLRTRIVLILTVVYLVAFIVLDMPGTVLFTLLILVLSYIPYFQYLALIPIALGCLVLSIENDHGFLLYFGIVLGVFVIASLLEELILTPYIMEANIGMNPVIMVVAISVWSYILGTPGLLLGVPLTSLIMIYIKRFFLKPFLETTGQAPIKEIEES